MTVQKKIGCVVFAVIFSAIVFASAFFGAHVGVAEYGGIIRKTVETDEHNESHARSISIPGYDSIKLKADQAEQSVYLYNPERNDCYFIVMLIVDGNVVFASEPIYPGDELTEITLNQNLSAGIYDDVILRYSCYDMTDTTKELNGADVVIKLEVEP